MMNLYRRFIQEGAANLRLFNDLLKNGKKGNAPIEWSDQIQNSFSEPKPEPMGTILQQRVNDTHGSC